MGNIQNLPRCYQREWKSKTPELLDLRGFYFPSHPLIRKNVPRSYQRKFKSKTLTVLSRQGFYSLLQGVL